MKSVVVSKTGKSLIGRLTLPASKSISNRLLIIRALSGTEFPIQNLSKADDTLLLQRLLSEVQMAGKRSEPAELDTANAGTVMRFLTAFLTLSGKKWILTGSERMKQRPIMILVEALVALGARIDYLARLGNPPLLIHDSRPSRSEVIVDAGVSSQYCSALLMIAPCMPGGLTIHLKGHTVSSPYITMTVRLMKYFGARVSQSKHQIKVLPGPYSARDFTVEADWSAAAFWYEAAVFADEVDLFLEGLRPGSIQGDSLLSEMFRNFGVHTDFCEDGIRLTKTSDRTDGYYFDFTDYPDIALPVISTCAGLGIRGRFEGLKSLKIKETDRLLAMKNELTKLGIPVETTSTANVPPTLEIRAGKMNPVANLAIETYGDHRMAMTFAPLALKLGTIRICNPDVVGKSYPGYWDDLARLGFDLRNG
jgi:3-phosphoshikimate 1-carboxyvinyltransferase